MNQKRKLILQALELDNGISTAQRAAIEAILRDQPTPLQPLLLKQREVAEILGLSRQAVYNLKKSGIIKPIQITSSGCERYKREDITKLINDGMPRETGGNK